MQRIIAILLFLFLFSGTSLLWGQTLTISESGQNGTSGTNWSIRQDTLLVNGEANIQPAVLENALSIGDLYVKVIGGQSSVVLNATISSDSKSNLRIEASQEIIINNCLEIASGTLWLTVQDQGKASGKITINNTVSVSNLEGQGGDIYMEAKSILLSDKANLQAQGRTGGGNILVGGDWQGGASEENRVFEDPKTLLQATKVTMDPKAFIDTSATENGNGGTVVLWSDIHDITSVTKAQGTIFAKGGSISGDGGKIETSGFELLIQGIKVKTDSPNGASGIWLLDPYDYVINSSEASTISNALTGGTTVTVSTGTSNSSYGSSGSNLDSGSIYVNAAISGSGSGNLSLEAGKFIYFNADVSTTGNQSYSGRVFVKKSNLSLSTNGGNITFSNDIYGLTGSES
ncbi:MAG: hypothetical protein QNL28_02820, partial [Flavobacteriaceae bacterium]